MVRAITTHPVFQIAIADDDFQSLEALATCLSHAHHEVVARARSAAELVKKCADTTLGLIIADVQLPSLDRLTAACDISEQHDIPVIAISNPSDEQWVGSESLRISRYGRVFAYLSKPIRAPELLAAIPLTLCRLQDLRTLRETAEECKRALEERKLVERAKGIMMRRQQVDEATAYRQLQQLARSHRIKLGEVARGIVLAHDAMQFPAAS